MARRIYTEDELDSLRAVADAYMDLSETVTNAFTKIADKMGFLAAQLDELLAPLDDEDEVDNSNVIPLRPPESEHPAFSN